RLNSHLNESIQGIRITQSFTQEKENTEFFEGGNQDNYDSFNDAIKKIAMFSQVVEMCNAIETIILISYGAFLILQGDMEIGTFVAFALFLGMFWEPISRLGQMYNQLLMAMAESERIFEFID